VPLRLALSPSFSENLAISAGPATPWLGHNAVPFPLLLPFTTSARSLASLTAHHTPQHALRRSDSEEPEDASCTEHPSIHVCTFERFTVTTTMPNPAL
jgi:hypothetical protein